MTTEPTNPIERLLADLARADAEGTPVEANREDVRVVLDERDEMIAVVDDQRSEIDRLNLLIYQQVNSIDRAVRNVEEAIVEIEEATRGLMILRKPQVNTLLARAETLLARMEAVTDE